MKHAGVLLAVFSVFATIRQSESLNCFVCDSESDPNCVSPENHKMNTQECVPTNLDSMKTTVEKLGLNKYASVFEVEIGGANFNPPLNCVKIVSKVANKEVIMRGCQLAPNADLDVCKKLVEEAKEVIQHCNLCGDNGCNSAPVKAISTLLLLFIPTIALL